MPRLGATSPLRARLLRLMLAPAALGGNISPRVVETTVLRQGRRARRGPLTVGLGRP